MHTKRGKGNRWFFFLILIVRILQFLDTRVPVYSLPGTDDPGARTVLASIAGISTLSKEAKPNVRLEHSMTDLCPT